MKKILVIVILSLMVVGVRAQSKTEFGFTIGAGAVLHKKAFNEFAPEKGTTINFGVFVSQPVFNKQFIQSGVLYNIENPKMDVLYMDIDYNLPLNSAEIPLYFGWEFTPKFIVKAGVSALWLLNKNIEDDEVGFDWHFGLGYKLSWVELSLNYQQGFNDMNFKFRDGSEGWGIIYKRRVIRLNANIPISNFLRN